MSLRVVKVPVPPMLRNNLEPLTLQSGW